ncbi:TIGR03086 family metal-binding protein [Amycolatopsis anabasis]|uniref:TIGR03086 family metal-binding protein n=1 Tax=Amycolatopsis anabasis TaxID=1840409 RepID=UPI00131E529C|nr:TIGR03086 family metal-binding protein [Amycolatopsis anabasis]
MDFSEVDRRAIAATGRIIEGLGAADWGRPTPCSGWAVRDVVAHLIGNNENFGAQAAGRTPPSPVERPDHALAGAYAESAARYLEDFAGEGALERRIVLGEFGTFPGSVTAGVHFVDVLVHGWDLGQALGLDYLPEDDLALPALAFAERYPDAAPVRGPGGAFAYPVEVPEDARPGERLIALLGRPIRTVPTR